MTIWAERCCTIEDWGRTQSLFEKRFTAAARPRDMMLVYEDAGDRQGFRLLAGLPDGTPLALYDGFSEIPPETLPKIADLLVGHNDRFSELFSFPNP